MESEPPQPVSEAQPQRPYLDLLPKTAASRRRNCIRLEKQRTDRTEHTSEDSMPDQCKEERISEDSMGKDSMPEDSTEERMPEDSMPEDSMPHQG